MLARGLDIVVGVRCTRKLEDGRQVRDLMVRGSLVKPTGLDQTMCISWVWLYRNTEPEQRFVEPEAAAEDEKAPGNSRMDGRFVT
ncbi:hypothetical protein ASF71_21125 [Deinococcus sp. Leaf326]|nr:hypothetical protein ASF71_21125 [Deinococcus sp. Leaf326]